MSDTTATTADARGSATSGHAAPDDAHDAAGRGEHAAGEKLGPIDWRAWGAGLVGVAAGLIVLAGLYLATGPH